MHTHLVASLRARRVTVAGFTPQGAVLAQPPRVALTLVTLGALYVLLTLAFAGEFAAGSGRVVGAGGITLTRLTSHQRRAAQTVVAVLALVTDQTLCERFTDALTAGAVTSFTGLRSLRVTAACLTSAAEVIVTHSTTENKRTICCNFSKIFIIQ